MFFEEQLFEDFDLNGYKKSGIGIPNTNVYVYEFECVESEEDYDDEAKAKKLDQLTSRLKEKYGDAFQIIYSESSQYFCKKIYPLVVKFETKLRYTVYVSRALFENGNISKESFRFEIDKQKKEMEELDFGKLYEALFTDIEIQEKVKRINGKKLTKADLIREIESLEEQSIWEQIVGIEYGYIADHFLEIKKYRNDVMHNHLMVYEEYIRGQEVLQRAIVELDRVIDDKLLVNNSNFSNDINIIDVLSGIVTAIGIAAVAANKIANSEIGKGFIKGLATLGQICINDALPSDEEENTIDEEL